MDSRRQKKIGQLIQDEMSTFLQKEGANYYGNKFVTVTDVSITSDLQNCKIHVSVFDKNEGEKVVDSLNSNIRDIRRRFGHIMRNSLRIIPEMQFFLDDTLDTVYRMEELFKKTKEDNNNPPA